MHRHPTRAALAAVLLLAAGCARQENTRLGGFPSFVKDPSDRPVLESGTAGWPSFIADPSIIADTEGYHLFYTALFCRRTDGSLFFSYDPEHPQDCGLTGARGATAYAFSSDGGLSWRFRPTPVVTSGEEAWNDGDIETPFAFREGDRLSVVYCALGSAGGGSLRYRYQLGVATLDLGGRSIREALLDTDLALEHRREPLVAEDRTVPYGINNAQEPSVVVRDERFELFFVSLGLAKPDQDVTAPGQEVSVALRRAVFDPTWAEVEPPSAPLLTGSSANITEVRYFDGRYHLFATTTELDDHENDFVTYSSSGDGIHFTAPTTILWRGPEPGFDDWGLMAPTVVTEPSEVRVFYTAWQRQDQHCQLTGAGGRLGMPQESRPAKARCLYPTLARAVSRRAGDTERFVSDAPTAPAAPPGAPR